MSDKLVYLKLISTINKIAIPNSLVLLIPTFLEKCMSYKGKKKRSFLPREVSKLTKLIIKTREYLTQKNNIEPTLEEISDYLHIDKMVVMDAIHMNDSIVSLDEMHADDESLYNAIGKYNPNLDDLLDVKEFINTLDSPDKDILLLRYFNDYTQEELAKLFHMSQVSVSRILTRNVKKLQNALK